MNGSASNIAVNAVATPFLGIKNESGRKIERSLQGAIENASKCAIIYDKE
jgi:hypothetical protein